MQILNADPTHADAYFLLAMIALASGNVAKALELVDRALSLRPGVTEYVVQRARCCSLLKRDADALAAAADALAAGVTQASDLDVLGVVHARAGDHGRATELFSGAAARAPGNAGISYNLASSLQFLGRFDEAEAAFEAAVSAAPRFYRAHAALAEIRRQTEEANHIDRLEGLLATVGDDVDAELYLRHALAKENEDLGRYDLAFEHWRRGKGRKKTALGYSITDDRALFDAATDAFGAERMAEPVAGHDSNEPIFVVGMPRSGTTLVERILSSHSAVQSAGELQHLGLAVKRATGTPSARVLEPETLRAAASVDCAALGRQYIDSTRTLTGKRPRFVDKMPLNFFYLGLIHRALPAAKIVCLARDPLDTCLSNFRQLFALEFAYYRYAYDPIDIADYLAMFTRLMAHWDHVLPGKLLHVRYERLIDAPEEQVRRLLAHCGLDYEPGCLEFERNAAPVATASAIQVRRPFNKASIGRWRNYRAALEPVRERLTSQGIELDS